MKDSFDYGPWSLNHPVAATLVFTAGGITGTLVGAGLAWLAVSLRWLSGSNELAGAAFGIIGAVAGFAAATIILLRRNDRRS
jgi:hypothetical protein